MPDLFVQSTLGAVRFDSAVSHDIGALPGTQVGRENRAQVLSIARQVAAQKGIVVQPSDRVVVFINPPPCDAGAYGDQALLDQGAEHTYFAHELGHIIGYSHSFGNNLTANTFAEYGDPYCIMSARTFGGSWPQGTGAPVGAQVPAGVPTAMWNGSGPLASAALTANTFADFNQAPRVIAVSSDYALNPVEVCIVDLGSASADNAVLATVDTGRQTFYVEHRSGTGWDRGLAEAPQPEPAIVIHRRKRGDTRVAYAGAISLAGDPAGRRWTAGDDDVRIEVVESVFGQPSNARIRVSGCFTEPIAVPEWFGFENQGAGVTIGDINGSGRPDLVLHALDNPAGENHGYYRVGFDLDSNGNAAVGGNVLPVPGWFGAENQGAGIAMADINGSGRPDFVVFHVDNPGGENHGYFRVGFDIDDWGAVGSWGPVIPVPGWFGAEDQGADIVLSPTSHEQADQT